MNTLLTQPAPGEDLGLAFARLRQSLRSYLLRRVSDSALAEDLLQEIFVKALVADRAGKKISNEVGWLYAVARTTVIDHYRSRREPAQPLDDNLAESEAVDLSLHSALSNCLLPFVDQLPPIYRDTLLATDIRGETMRALAEQQHVSVSAIKSRASRARGMLREKLLACCHVEMTDGLVSDYRPHARAPC